MDRYTKEMHEECRRQEDEKTNREEEARRERTEKETARRQALCGAVRKILVMVMVAMVVARSTPENGPKYAT